MTNNNIWQYPSINGSGYVLRGALPSNNNTLIPVPDQNAVRQMEPPGSIPTRRIDRSTGFSQVANLSQHFNYEKIQAAFRAAEQGDPRLLFTYYRDFFQGNSIVYSAISARKRATLSQPWKIIPASKDKKDIKAAKAIEYILKHTPKLNDSFIHLMNALVYPVALAEKTFGPAEKNDYGVSLKLTGIHPIDYNLVSYKVAYVPQVMSTGMTVLEQVQFANEAAKLNKLNKPVDNKLALPLTNVDTTNSTAGNYQYNPDDQFEPDIRLWPLLPNGIPVQIPAMMIPLDPNRIVVFRNNLMLGTSRENFGGLGKSLLFLSVMSQLSTQQFMLCMQKYGLPFIKIQADEQQIDTVNKIIETFGDMSQVINAIAVNKDAQVEIEQINMAGASEGHSMLLNYIKDLIYLLVNGEVLSSHTSTGGMGKGKDSIQSDVREDIVKFDRILLAECFQTQIFPYLLKWNNIEGETPSIVWGGSITTDEMKTTSETIYNLSNSGYELTSDAIESMGEKFGMTFQKIDNDIEDNNKVNVNTKNKVVNKEEVDNKDDIEDDKEEVFK
jgi:phage gp29-like protein